MRCRGRVRSALYSGGTVIRRREHETCASSAITSIVVGVVMAIAGVVTWVVVSSTLADQKITVADDANCAAGDDVNGPISAYCQADIIDHHTMDITGGLTYAELGRRTRTARWRWTPRSCRPPCSPRSSPSASPAWRSSSGSC